MHDAINNNFNFFIPNLFLVYFAWCNNNFNFTDFSIAILYQYKYFLFLASSFNIFNYHLPDLDRGVSEESLPRVFHRGLPDASQSTILHSSLNRVRSRPLYPLPLFRRGHLGHWGPKQQQLDPKPKWQQRGGRHQSGTNHRRKLCSDHLVNLSIMGKWLFILMIFRLMILALAILAFAILALLIFSLMILV